jgi:hypothetical protein
VKEGKETVHRFQFTAFLPESFEKYFAEGRSSGSFFFLTPSRPVLTGQWQSIVRIFYQNIQQRVLLLILTGFPIMESFVVTLNFPPLAVQRKLFYLHRAKIN